MATIRIDATALTMQQFTIISAPGEGQRDSAGVQTVVLRPGVYRFGTLFGPTFPFEVTDDGDVVVDPILAAFASGAGATLTVTGLDVVIDATALSLRLFWLQDPASGLIAQFGTETVQPLRLIPGAYRFGTLADPDFVFEVTQTGEVDFLRNLDPFLSGRGTNTLTVNGFAITIDATALSLPFFWLQDVASGLLAQFESNSAHIVTLIPGSYRFGTLVDPDFAFEVDSEGNVQHNRDLDAFVSGRGTQTLTVGGIALTIDATGLTYSFFWLQDSASGLLVQLPTKAPQPVTLLPGHYRFGTLVSPAFVFEVDPIGNFAFESELDGFLLGRGRTTLEVRGFPVTIDATYLSLPLFWVQDSASGMLAQFPTAVEQSVMLIPGTYRFGTLVSPSFHFDLGLDGMVVYDPASENFLSGSGTNRLEVNGFIISVDASRLGVGSFSIQDSASGDTASFDATRHQCVSLLPGDYVLRAGFTFPFTVILAGVSSFSPAFDACVRGRGTQHLRVVCDPGA